MHIYRGWFVVFLFMLAISGWAQEDNPNGIPNDPKRNIHANSCFEGGMLFEKCDKQDLNLDGSVTTDEIKYMWDCGWYHIRYVNGMISYQAFPNLCKWLLVPPSMSMPAVAGCQILWVSIQFVEVGGEWVEIEVPISISIPANVLAGNDPIPGQDIDFSSPVGSFDWMVQGNEIALVYFFEENIADAVWSDNSGWLLAVSGCGTITPPAFSIN